MDTTNEKRQREIVYEIAHNYGRLLMVGDFKEDELYHRLKKIIWEKVKELSCIVAQEELE